jgi:hypothetical protein
MMVNQVSHKLKSQNGNSNRGKILLDENQKVAMIRDFKLQKAKKYNEVYNSIED